VRDAPAAALQHRHGAAGPAAALRSLRFGLEATTPDALPFMTQGFRIMVQFTFLIDCRRPVEALWADMRDKTRNLIRRAQERLTIEEVEDELQEIRRSLLETDGPRHASLRALMQREFSPRALRGYEGFLRELTKQTVDKALEHGEFDFVSEVSADFPIQVLARMLDVPASDTGQLIAWGDEFVGNTDPDMTKFRADLPDSDQYKHLPFRSPTVLDVWDYGDALKAERKGKDGTDLISILANRMPSDGIPVSDNDFHQYFTLLVIAGNETTRHTISHSMLALIDNPDQLRTLQERPELIPAAVEEMLRWASPVYYFRRTATRDVEMHGQTIREGDKVVMWFASGNRDEAVFEDPYRFDVTRTNVDHMTFGKGSPHLCLGSNLARMEIQLMFQELLPRIKTIERAGVVQRLRSNFANGIKKLPVRVVPA
ncbi:MAG TPA: cytochrome P450, partial [Dermatophilaceae bacterium]|nr:cytochrome P450 [Dermatophilaceae bacterium]